jgi:type VI secretion system secreted protein Hcp
MAADYFLKIDGIKGEAMDSKFKDQIDVESFSWGVSQAGTFASGGGGGAGKAAMQDLHFVAKVSKASPNLLMACATGQHIKEATLTCRKAGGDQQVYYTVKLNDVLVSSYQSAGSEGGGSSLPVDQFALNFSKIEFEYKAQKADGTLDAAVKAGYDVKLNKKV